MRSSIPFYAFSQLCVDLKDEIEEIDINPLLVFDIGKGAKVVDCLITRRPTIELIRA